MSSPQGYLQTLGVNLAGFGEDLPRPPLVGILQGDFELPVLLCCLGSKGSFMVPSYGPLPAFKGLRSVQCIGYIRGIKRVPLLRVRMKGPCRYPETGFGLGVFVSAPWLLVALGLCVQCRVRTADARMPSRQGQALQNPKPQTLNLSTLNPKP